MVLPSPAPASMLVPASAPTIAIVGGGCSGSLVAAQLLRQANTPVTVYLIERRSSMGQGVAYSTPRGCHLLNVPAGKMSAFANDPHHFLRWLQQSRQRDPLQRLGLSRPTAACFLPRQLYGHYIQDVLAEAATRAVAGIRLEQLTDEVMTIQPQGAHAVLTLRDSPPITADRVVLALGNFSPAHPPGVDSRFCKSQRYIGSAWSTDWISSVAPEEPVLLIGSGLTAIDQVVALQEQGHRGPIRLVSRRGLLPQPHQTVAPYPLHWQAEQLPTRVRDLLRQLRLEVAFAEAQGYDWRAVIDALRPVTSILWQRLPLAEQQRFLRHGRPYWEVHRHRVAPAVADCIARLQASRQLESYAGRILACQEDAQGVDVLIRSRGTSHRVTLRANYVINCTGPECDYRRWQHPLVQQLFRDGCLCPDPLQLGLKTMPNGAVIQANGIPSAWLYTLGAARKGQLWETTAVPEIREQAAKLAVELLHSLCAIKQQASGEAAAARDVLQSVPQS